jgi:hypothetical protein
LPYAVKKYSLDNFIKLIKDSCEAKQEVLETKNHVKYFHNYLGHLKVKKIILETDYIDKDYLEDYSAYYVRSFHEYKRRCCRLHFFSHSFTKSQFAALLTGDDSGLKEDDLQKNYLGFIVIRPLPSTVFGRTCLRSYSPEAGKRQYPIVRNYKASLFGINLSVESIAYQEQDKTVAACASSAIWSAFQGTGLLFQHPIPSPVKITKAATKKFPHANRHFPTEGLTSEQMAQAIRSIGLEPFLVNCGIENYDTLSNNIYAYLRGKIPMVFGFKIYVPDATTGEHEYKGKHAATVTGMSFQDNPKKFNGEEFYLKACRIDKIYVHDDQVGPFARMEKDGKKIIVDSKTGRQEISLSSSFGGTNTARAVPVLLVVPLYHKIRIPYSFVLKVVFQFNNLINNICSTVGVSLPSFEWDIYLEENSRFKHELTKSNLSGKQKHDLVTQPLPRFIWRAICCVKEEKKYEFLFDATDIEQGKMILEVIDYDPTFSLPFKRIAKSMKTELVSNTKVREILEKIKSS